MAFGRTEPAQQASDPVTVAITRAVAVAEAAPGFKNMPPKEQALARSIVAGIVAGMNAGTP